LLAPADSRPLHQPNAWLTAAAALAVVGWGANQFAPLLVMYEERSGVSVAAAQGMFALYAIGLVPGLFVGGPLSDRRDRRTIVLWGLGLSLVASVALGLGGTWHTGFLYVGRLVAGVASGVVFSCGTAWLQELSTEGPGGTPRGPARATISMTAGFALGPLVAGVFAQYAPRPLLTAYLPHVVLLLVAYAAVSRMPRTTPVVRRIAVDATGSVDPGRRRLRMVVLPLAPWVFITGAVGLAILPGSAREAVAGHAVLFASVAVSLCAFAGLVMQPVVRVLHHRRRTVKLTSFGLAVAGLVLGALATAYSSVPLVLAGVVVLGGACGALMVTGLTDARALAPPHALGRTVATFQAGTYAGYVSPFFIALLNRAVPLPTILTALAVAAAATATWVVLTEAVLGSRGN